MAYPILAAQNTWYKSSVNRNTITKINIVDSYIPTGNEEESWNADVNNSGSIKCYRNGTELTLAGDGSGKISMNANSNCAFSHTSASNQFVSLSQISGLELFDTSNTTDMSDLFRGACSITELNLSSFDVSKVTTMFRMFSGNGTTPMSLQTINISTWRTKSLTTIAALFQYCSNLTSVVGLGALDTTNVTDMRNVFYHCTSIENIDVSTKNINDNDAYIAWNTSSVKLFDAMFAGNNHIGDMKIKNLDVSGWDTSSATSMTSMFYGCAKLTELLVDNWNVSNVTSFDHTFTDCFQLEKLNVSKWTTASVTTFYGMFNDCRSLKEIDVSNFITTKAVMFSQMFENCSSLEKIIGLEKFDTSAIDIGTTKQELAEVFKGCSNIEELDLSSFDTRRANSLKDFFTGMTKLKKVILSEKFSFFGNGQYSGYEGILPTPSMTGADGYWYSMQGRQKFAPTDIPDRVATTYYAIPEELDNEDMLIKYGTLSEIANTIRTHTNSNRNYNGSELAEAVVEAIEAGGVNLPDLNSPATADEIFAGKEAIDENGNVLSGSFTIEKELSEQDDLISQIENALNGKVVSGGIILEALDNPATASDIASGKQAYSDIGELIIGIAESSSGGTGGASGGAYEVIINASNTTNAIQYVDYTSSVVTRCTGGSVTLSTLNGVIASTGKQISSATGEYITITIRSGYYVYIFPTNCDVVFS